MGYFLFDLEARERYISIEDFRARTGITSTDINDIDLAVIIEQATQKIKNECYLMRRRELLSSLTDSNGVKRYYFSHNYLADGNLDGEIDYNDLEVIERNSDGTIENNITNQVNTIDIYNGYFTLNSGYPSNDSYNIICTYFYTRFPLDEVTYELEELCESLTMTYFVKRAITNSYKRGIKNISVPGLSISREADSFKEMLSYYQDNAKRLLNKLKPIKFVNYKGNTGRTQFPNSAEQPIKKDYLGSTNSVDYRVNKYRG